MTVCQCADTSHAKSCGNKLFIKKLLPFPSFMRKLGAILYIQKFFVEGGQGCMIASCTCKGLIK